MTSKKDAIAALALERGTNMPVTAWITQYRKEGSPMNMDCLEIAYQAMVRDLTSGSRSDGSRRLRPSMIGNPCWRAQAMSYLGAPAEDDRDSPYLDAAKAGTLSHYWFQAEGMSAGWLTDIEVQVEYKRWHLTGAMDGVCKDGSIFELKTVSTEKYNGWRGAPAVEAMEMAVDSHIKQVHAYMAATGEGEASIVYLDRGGLRFREFRVKRDKKLLEQMDIEATDTLARIAEGKLPARLFGCEMLQDGFDPDEHSDSEVKSWKAGQRWCDFKHICHKADPKDWS
jgi:hypothetical protein